MRNKRVFTCLFAMVGLICGLDYGFSFPKTLFFFHCVWFHGYVCSFLFGILIFVIFILYYLVTTMFFFKLTGSKYQTSEIICSAIPALIILALLCPSFILLYTSGMLETESELTIKILGHQWYWSYEYCDIEGLEFDSYMLLQEDLEVGMSRLLEVDRRLVLPCGVNIRLCFSSGDVIHSWALPEAGIKVDCVPGLLSSLTVKFPFVGVFYGQCSELCGAGHTYMPIVLEVCSFECFTSWAMLELCY